MVFKYLTQAVHKDNIDGPEMVDRDQNPLAKEEDRAVSVLAIPTALPDRQIRKDTYKMPAIDEANDTEQTGGQASHNASSLITCLCCFILF